MKNIFIALFFIALGVFSGIGAFYMMGYRADVQRILLDTHKH